MQATEGEVQALYRALTHRDTDAWEVVWRSWRTRVSGWVRRHPQYRYTHEEVEYFVNRAFEKLWRAVDGAKLEQFDSPGRLIQYFKLCVHSVVMDELRGKQPDNANAGPLAPDMEELPAGTPGVEETVISRVRCDELWRTVASHVKSEEERVLVAAALVRGMPPRVIATRYPGLFGSVDDVYRLKRNLMERLSRDKRLREFL